MLRQYLSFLKRSLYTHKHDIAQPYHKVIDLIIKLISLGFAIFGLFYVVGAPYCYLSSVSGEIGKMCVYFIHEIHTPLYIMSEVATIKILVAKWMIGIGYLLSAIFLSQVLVVRHLNETLPDQIYLRCFSSEDEKQQRLPLKDHVI